MDFILAIIFITICLTISRILSNLILGALFSIFKADKYEDHLANKIAKQVSESKVNR